MKVEWHLVLKTSARSAANFEFVNRNSSIVNPHKFPFGELTESPVFVIALLIDIGLTAKTGQSAARPILPCFRHLRQIKIAGAE